MSRRGMTDKPTRTERRSEALTKEQIVEAAVEILDTQGEAALTFRTLAARLATGSGAIYWHVANKDHLLATAADHVIAQALAGVSGHDDGPQSAIRAIALAVFDAFDAHSWVGARLSLAPDQSAMLGFFEAIGSQLQHLGVSAAARFDAWSALVNYILGVAAQNADNARRRHVEVDRETLLAAMAARWQQLDPDNYPFLREVAAHLPGHDDREQFLAGIDLILTGIMAEVCP
jgi:AcrR family transcriptional regulator